VIAGSIAAAPVQAAERAVAGEGMALDAAVRAGMESELGHDFSAVRVHHDRQAAAAADALDAAAFTLDGHIGFAADAFRPTTPSGLDLLRHELVHVVQQRAGGGPAPDRPALRQAQLGPTHSPAEAEAEAATSVRGAGAVPVSGRMVQRAPRTAAPSRHITHVYVDQAGQSQTVRWRWSDTGMDGRVAPCSAGKGHCCCEDPGTPACSAQDTRATDSNYTPVGNFVVARPAHSNHPPFWTEFVPNRGIALHQYTPVDGTPLSHGCVRMDEADAEIVHTGARPGVTVVHVTGLPTPLCSRPSLRAEWADDFNTAGTERRDGEHRTLLRSAFGVDDAGLSSTLTAAGSPATAASVAGRIPRCLGPSVEEQELARLAPGTVAPATGLRDFASRLGQTRSMAAAEAEARRFGRSLWSDATARAQRSRTPNTDDRLLYFARLQALSAIRAWQPRWTANPDERRRSIPPLLAILEQASRGLDTFSFPQQRARGTGAEAVGTKRIVISGFDPFDASGSIDIASADRTNPSASAVLALDGTLVTAGSGAARVQGRVEGVVFPVRYRDFDAGIVENALRPHLTGPPVADLVMTISRGSSLYELEEQAGRRRSGSPDNERVGGVAGSVTSGGAANDPEFIRTSVSSITLAGMRGAIPRTGAIPEEVNVVERDPSTGAVARVPAPTPAPAPGHGPAREAVEGSGSNFLSNEVFYRASRLRRGTNPSVPVIHLHVPQVTGVDPPAERAAVIAKVRQIIAGALPTL
jgi:hypothetical protein